MSTLIRAARAMAAVCLFAVIGLGESPTATADPTDNQANNDKLSGLLSGGYIPAECQASKPYPEDPFLARLGCGSNDLPGGPVSAIYSLYGSVADLNNSFNIYVNSGTPVPCPGTTGPGPSAWQGGMVLCATSNQQPDEGAPFIAWTRNADLLVVSAKPKGRDLAPLYAWWLTAR
jgi:hypothetical protein